MQYQRPQYRSADAQKHEKMDVPAQEESEFTLPLPFCSIQALKGLDGAHLHWQGLSSLLSLLTLFWKHSHRHIQKQWFTSYPV